MEIKNFTEQITQDKDCNFDPMGRKPVNGLGRKDIKRKETAIIKSIAKNLKDDRYNLFIL